MAREILPGVRVTADQLFVLALTAALMVGLHLLLTRTTLGRAMRAASENPALLAVTGIDPGRRRALDVPDRRRPGRRGRRLHRAHRAGAARCSASSCCCRSSPP